jgi:hypothetical protein
MPSRESLNSKLREPSITSTIWDTTMVVYQDQEEDLSEEMLWDQLVISILHRFIISLTMIIQIHRESLQKMLLSSSISWELTELISREPDQRIQCTTIRTTTTEKIEPTGYTCSSAWASSATPPPNSALNKIELEELQDLRDTKACQPIISTTEVVSLS